MSGCKVRAAINIGGAKTLAEIGAPLFCGRRSALRRSEPAAEMGFGYLGGGDQADARNFRRLALPVRDRTAQNATDENARSFAGDQLVSRK